MDIKTPWLLLGLCLTVDLSYVSLVSKTELGLLAEEDDPKCFTRTGEDFTCFWEAEVGKSYDFFYRTEDEERQCNLTQQEGSERGTVLHVCSFHPESIFLYVPTHISVVDTRNNETAYKRSVNVEDHLLLHPPKDVRLSKVTGNVGQLEVSWHNPKFQSKVSNHMLQYEIRYSSMGLPYTTILLPKSQSVKRSLLYNLKPLGPGKVCTVQMRMKPTYSFDGPWSDWSPSTTAMVPQSADDIRLQCYTPDLQHMQCSWNEKLYADEEYTLKYRQTDGFSNRWSQWETCPDVNGTAGQCVLLGEESSVFSVYVSTGPGLLDRVFYMDPFSMNESIKTEPPGGLMEETEGGRFCLSWDPPLQLISQHLVYQVRYQLWGEAEWKHFTVPNPKTNTCLDVQMSSRYSVQVKAVPSGSVYAGHWSDWSDSLIVDLPSNTGLLFLACIPFTLLILLIVFFSLFSKYFSKLKRYLWPPVPNLNDVLESFLKDISGQHGDHSFNIKQCDDDSPPSILEILSERGVQAVGKPFLIQSSETGSPAGENDGRGPLEAVEMGQGYVTLNTTDVVSCLGGNEYVYGEVVASSQGEHRTCRCSCPRPAVCPVSSTNILNCSYLLLAESDVSAVNGRYANLENATTASA
ncbi:thrombopoietin receptor [Chanos chanos]|uniref:Thrombopoietin receptor n=1 Tax=Chanos chanos TaxID=29144 RepID=A0A6J2WSA5_CHACN|nr:thrombopoietin receptor [Chanos chanos]